MANSKLCAKYAFEKPNDKRALDLMNAAARAVMTDLPDITIAYGVSDEYSFVFHKSCHINNLYNTTFWALIQLGGMDNRAAEELLAGTVSGDKNEILFSRFHINYNNEPEMYKKGSVVFRDYELVEPGTHNVQADADAIAEPVSMTKSQTEKDKKRRNKARIVIEHLDIIKDDFWDRRPWLLSNKPGKAPKET
ncbi:Putative caffeoyl-CoA O-methyltransferase 2 [Verticillium dahliae VDG2]|nr:Putative caffeoyl-CoA O-methyltransferase 2 [Verticillium dahliae VDG2]